MSYLLSEWELSAYSRNWISSENKRLFLTRSVWRDKKLLISKNKLNIKRKSNFESTYLYFFLPHNTDRGERRKECHRIIKTSIPPAGTPLGAVGSRDLPDTDQWSSSYRRLPIWPLLSVANLAAYRPMKSLNFSQIFSLLWMWSQAIHLQRGHSHLIALQSDCTTR